MLLFHSFAFILESVFLIVAQIADWYETLAEMDRLLEEYTDAEVAEQLNQRGYRTFAVAASSFRASMSINCVDITAFPIGTPDYVSKA